MFVCFFTCIYYVALMAWSFSFFFASFTSELPWMLDDATKDGKVASVKQLWNSDYFNNETLKLSGNIQEQG
jgi:SNF family Na+-dependent transporter